jgi:hypothetical protein
VVRYVAEPGQVFKRKQEFSLGAESPARSSKPSRLAEQSHLKDKSCHILTISFDADGRIETFFLELK